MMQPSYHHTALSKHFHYPFHCKLDWEPECDPNFHPNSSAVLQRMTGSLCSEHSSRTLCTISWWLKYQDMKRAARKILSTILISILLTPKDHHQLEVYRFRDPHKQVSNQFVEDLLTVLQCQTCGQDHV